MAVSQEPKLIPHILLMPLTEASSIIRSPRPWLCLNGLDTRLLGPSEGNVCAFINFVHSCWHWREKQAYSPNCNATSGSVKIIV